MLSRFVGPRVIRGHPLVGQGVMSCQQSRGTHHGSGSDHHQRGHWGGAAQVALGIGALGGIIATAKAMEDNMERNMFVVKAERQIDAAEQEILDKENR